MPVDSSHGEPVRVASLGLGDIITLPDTDLIAPAVVVGITRDSTEVQVRFIDVLDLDTRMPHAATLCLNRERIVRKHGSEPVHAEDVESRPFL